MRKAAIFVITILLYTSIFPAHLLAEISSGPIDGPINEQGENVEVNTGELDKEGKNTNQSDDKDNFPEGEHTKTGEKSTEEKPIFEGDETPESTSSEEPGTTTEQKEAVPNGDNSQEIKGEEKEKITSNKNDSKDETTTDKEQEPPKAEYNEFGIKIGTEVYGEDISKLSEEELQYIPEGWRNGVVESGHAKEDKSRISVRSAYPDVNNYIISKNLTPATIEYDHKNFFTKFNYRNGFGRVEGIVAHETANPNSTITGEISYMSRNHKNAFVHAFVDHSRIIQIHPTEYGAWGAGRFANQRFVHVELVHVKTFDQFARSINNYADYIASVLHKYSLGVTSAEKSGKGTLWSHKAVSKHLGGTTHVDPHGYFAKWGYNWDDFVKLVTQKYNSSVTVKTTNISKLGHIRSTAKIYPNLNYPSSYKSVKGYTHAVYYIKKQADINGERFYLISKQPSSTKGVVGWVKAKDLVTHSHTGVDKKAKTLYIKGTGSAYSKAWGGSKNLVYKNLSSYKNHAFKVNLTERVGNNVWYRGTLNGKTAWLHSSYVTDQVDITTKNTSRLGHVRGSAKIYSDFRNQSSYKSVKGYTHAVYYIKKQADINGERFYLISQQPSSTKGVVGWVKAKDLVTYSHTGVDKKAKTLYIKGTGSAYSKAWGGSKNLVYKNLSSYKNHDFKVNLTERVGNNVWYRGTLNGKTAWLHSSYVTDQVDITTKNTSRLGHVRGSAKIYSDYRNQSSYKSVKGYTHAVYYIKKQADINGERFYLISQQPSSTKGVVGWVKAKDLVTYSHTGVDKKAKTLYIKGTGSAYSKAWGGSKDIVFNNLSKYKGQRLKVNLTEKVGNNVWYRGILNGRTIWVHNSFIK